MPEPVSEKNVEWPMCCSLTLPSTRPSDYRRHPRHEYSRREAYETYTHTETVFKRVKFPCENKSERRQIEKNERLTAGVTDLNASLANMNGDNFSHFLRFCEVLDGEYTDKALTLTDVQWPPTFNQNNVKQGHARKLIVNIDNPILRG